MRQDGLSERTDDRTNAARDIADDWDDHRGCCWDSDNAWGYAVAGAAVGAAVGYAAAANPVYVTALPCSPILVTMNGTSFYQCGTTWYNRTYVSGNLSYVVVDPPPGY